MSRSKKTPWSLFRKSVLLALGLSCWLTAHHALAVPDENAQESAAVNWWDANQWLDPDRGFNWYPDLQEKKAREKKEKRKPLEQMTMDEIRKEVERLRDISILNPTEQNVLRYMRAQKWVVDKADIFQSVWKRTLYKYPDVDAEVVNPSAQYVQTALKQQYVADRNELLNELRKTHGIIFFARSDCRFCHMVSPILKMMNERYGVEVMAVSMDRGPIPNFPNAKPDNGISFKLTGGTGVDVVPQMFLVSRDMKEIFPLGGGAMTLEEIIERIRMLTTTTPNNVFEKTWSVTR